MNTINILKEIWNNILKLMQRNNQKIDFNEVFFNTCYIILFFNFIYKWVLKNAKENKDFFQMNKKILRHI